MYLILHKYLDPVTHIQTKMPDYKFIGGWDAKDALSEFYKQKPYPGIDSTMFDTIINKIDLEHAVALHNALRPTLTITAIYQVSDKAEYIAETVKVGEIEEDRSENELS